MKIHYIMLIALIAFSVASDSAHARKKEQEEFVFGVANPPNAAPSNPKEPSRPTPTPEQNPYRVPVQNSSTIDISIESPPKTLGTH